MNKYTYVHTIRSDNENLGGVIFRTVAMLLILLEDDESEVKISVLLSL